MRIIMILILTFLLFGTGTLTAQENCFAHQEKWVKRGRNVWHPVWPTNTG